MTGACPDAERLVGKDGLLTGTVKQGLRALVLFACALIFCAGVTAAEPSGGVKPVKYVFLFIGDGMAPPQRAIAEEYAKATGKPGLLINGLEVHGFTTTHSHNKTVTDSAAAGTALACGVKANNGMLGLDANMQPVESVAKVAKDAGRKVGIITDVPITHATPAAFYAHTSSRDNSYGIGLDLVKSGFDYFAGGAVAKANGKKGNINDLAKAAGYTLIHGREEFAKLNSASGDKLLISFATSEVINNNKERIPLKDLTAKAIELLDNPKGFFIMVEGGRIDWACHANDAPTAIHETLAFDEAVKTAWDFAQKRPDETLIVVTGDHETGALTVGFAGTGYTANTKILAMQKISAGKFASKINSGLKSKDKALTLDEVKEMISQDFGLKFSGAADDPAVLSPAEIERIEKAFERAAAIAGGAKKSKEESTLYGSYNPVAITVAHILSAKAGLRWDTFGHSAMPVQTSAFGVMKEMFKDKTDNVDIGKRLKLLVGKID